MVSKDNRNNSRTIIVGIIRIADNISCVARGHGFHTNETRILPSDTVRWVKRNLLVRHDPLVSFLLFSPHQIILQSRQSLFVSDPTAVPLLIESGGEPKQTIVNYE